MVREECRCARITRFIAWLIDFLLDIGNVMRNFTLYRFFVGVLNGFYRLVDFFGRDRTPAVASASSSTASAVGSGSESGLGSLTGASAAASFVNTKALARGADDLRGSLNLGSLAALANYNLDGVEKAETDLNGTGTGTEEMSSFSEQAWDNYQEKYMSEPYSEDRDTDAARRLLDFGDDYRNFIDSQSDCASSSLSAANMDSLSPPRFRLKSESANKSETNANSLNRRKRLDEYRMDDRYGKDR